MKKLFSSKYTPNAVNAGMLILRLGLGLLMMLGHGYQKLTHFSDTAQHMPNLLGMGATVNGSLIVFAEFFCSIFIVLGLFTRLATIPLIVAMSVALFKAHGGDFMGQGQMAALFLIGFIVILFIGPGKASVDGAVG